MVQGQVLADIGCFIGHDLRHLVNDGAPANNLYGFDIIDFWDLGFEMFQDRDRFEAHFVQADIMAADSNLAGFKGKLGIIYIAQVRPPTSCDASRAHPQLSSSNKYGLRIGPPPMELGWPNRSMQETHQPLQARLSDRRQPDWQFYRSINSVGFYTTATVAPQ